MSEAVLVECCVCGKHVKGWPKERGYGYNLGARHKNGEGTWCLGRIYTKHKPVELARDREARRR